MTFKPGVSGNANGRPKGTLNKHTQLIKILEPHAPALINKCVELALAGSETCLKLTIDKLLPRAKTDKLTFDLPIGKIQADTFAETIENVLRQLESGEINLEQAQSLMNILKSYKSLMSKHIEPSTLLEKLLNNESI